MRFAGDRISLGTPIPCWRGHLTQPLHTLGMGRSHTWGSAGREGALGRGRGGQLVLRPAVPGWEPRAGPSSCTDFPITGTRGVDWTVPNPHSH